MNIGITCYSTYGGSGIVGSELGKELARRGHTVHFIARSLPTRLTELSDRIQFHEVEALNYPLFEAPHYTLALAVKMAEIGCREQLDLLHVHYAIPHSISGYLAREMLRGRHRLPIVTTLHGTDITLVGSDRSYLAVTRFAIAESDGVTAISDYLSRATCESFGLPNVRVIPNFVDVEYYRRAEAPELRERLAPEGQKLLVHVSNFRPVKRVNDCVEIFARVAREVDARLVMVGDGPDAAAAAALAEQLGLARDVVFVGKQPRIVDYLSIADVLLLPSETESFGLAALEAMSCSVPVVASRVGGLPEVVDEGVSGFLRPIGDVDGMAECTLRILTDAAAAARMGDAARRTAIERFTTERVIPQYLDYYREVLERFDPGPTAGAKVRYAVHVEAGEARETMRRVVQNLEGEYGVGRNTRGGDPLDMLVEIILSQQNSSASTRAVFAGLKRRFPTWQDALDAPVEEIEGAIRSGGLARLKAARIKALLASIREERGDLKLGFLRRMPTEEALAYLMRFKGVGPKTARCTLLFACGKDVFPMDVHIFRILERLGLLAPGTPDERAHRQMAEIIPEGKHYSAHVGLIQHGRRICRPTSPRCGACCIVDYCPAGQEQLLNLESDDPRL